MKFDPLLFNKLTFSILIGIITTPFFMWYDWVMVVEMLNQHEPLAIFDIFIIIDIFLVAAVLGIFSLSRVTYQVAPNARVMGFPFPSVFLEPDVKGSDIWIDFPLLWGVF